MQICFMLQPGHQSTRVRLNSSQWRHREMASTCFLSPTTNFFIICKENLCTPKLWKSTNFTPHCTTLGYAYLLYTPH
jgi:hypothetical protein